MSFGLGQILKRKKQKQHKISHPYFLLKNYAQVHRDFLYITSKILFIFIRSFRRNLSFYSFIIHAFFRTYSLQSIERYNKYKLLISLFNLRGCGQQLHYFSLCCIIALFSWFSSILEYCNLFTYITNRKIAMLKT